MRTAQQAGFDKVITFDMGGTSTDVAHYENAYERVFETVVAGVRMQAPMLLIHTVAAGGGSLCRFDGHASVLARKAPAPTLARPVTGAAGRWPSPTAM